MFNEPIYLKVSDDGNSFEYLPKFIKSPEAERLFSSLQQSIDWQHLPIILFGKKVMQPRLTAWCAIDDKEYVYSGLKMKVQQMPQELYSLLEMVSQHCQTQFNSVLLNNYRDGQDSMGWHRDNEPELGPEPIIASVSLGGERLFKIRKYREHQHKAQLVLEHGSLLVMRPPSQLLFEHALPKVKTVVSPRINLTFRQIID